MRHKIQLISIALFFTFCLTVTGFAVESSPYSFLSEDGKRYIWDIESESGVVFPSGFSFDQGYLPVGISISSDEMQFELISQTFPDKQETFWNFAFYSTSKFSENEALLNLVSKVSIIDENRVFQVSYEREPLLHERHSYRYHQLFFIERGTFQGDLFVARSKTPIDAQTALAYYKAADKKDSILLSTPSQRVVTPISNNENAIPTLLPDGPSAFPAWGIFEPSAPRYLTKVHALESELNASFPLILRYTSFADSFSQLEKDLAVAKNDQRIVELTLQTNESNRLVSSIYAVLDGKYDEQLHELARVVRDQEDPVLFRLNNEMNGDWCNYSALHYGLETALYRDVWNLIYQIFQEEGASNARWVFNPNERSFPQYRWNHMLAYLPDPDQIDAVGLTGYNTGNYYSGEIWRSFSEIYQPIYREYTQVFNYPFLITEFASSSVGGNKEEWIYDMFDSLDQFPKLEGLIWWNYADYDRKGRIARPYYIDETPEVMRAFKEGLRAYETRH